MVLRFPWGLAISTARYLWWANEFRRDESAGDATDLPPPLPAELVDDQIKTLDEGAGPLFHGSSASRSATPGAARSS